MEDALDLTGVKRRAGVLLLLVLGRLAVSLLLRRSTDRHQNSMISQSWMCDVEQVWGTERTRTAAAAGAAARTATGEALRKLATGEAGRTAIQWEAR